jgi:hypothetical protein
MMYHSSNMLEEPLMRAVADPVYVIVFGASKFRPAFGDNSTSSGSINSAKNGVDDTCRITQNNATKSDINRRWTGLKKLNKVCRWRELRRVTKEKPANIYTGMYC